MDLIKTRRIIVVLLAGFFLSAYLLAVRLGHSESTLRLKGTEQQGVLMLHRSRELLVRQRTMLVNGIGAHMAEFGIVAPAGVTAKRMISGDVLK